MSGSESPSRTVWTRRPCSPRVVGFCAWLALPDEAVDAFSACASSRSTSARIGSPLGWKRTNCTVRETGTDFGRATEPQRNVTNGGTDPPPPPPPPSVHHLQQLVRGLLDALVRRQQRDV